MSICICVITRVPVYVCMSVCEYLWTYAHVCVSIHSCVSVVCLGICVAVYVYVCVSMCLFLYFCIMGTSAGVSLSLCLRCLCPLLFRSLLILAHKNRLSPSLRNSVSRWVAWNQPLWKYLHHRNWQMLPVSTTPTKSPQPKHYQHFPAYHDPRLVVPKVAVEASLLKFLKL